MFTIVNMLNFRLSYELRNLIGNKRILNQHIYLNTYIIRALMLFNFLHVRLTMYR